MNRVPARARVPLARGRRANQTVCPRRELNQPSAVSNFGYLLLASRIPIVFPRIPEIAGGRIHRRILGRLSSADATVDRASWRRGTRRSRPRCRLHRRREIAGRRDASAPRALSNFIKNSFRPANGFFTFRTRVLLLPTEFAAAGHGAEILPWPVRRPVLQLFSKIKFLRAKGARAISNLVIV